MEIRTMPVDQLKPAPYNPRIPLKPGTARYRRLERSLREFSLVEPIVWNEQTGHVVAGHQRLEILKNQGVSEVDVSVVSLPLEREKALNIALNNSEVGSDWDAEKLIDVLTELSELEEFDATLTGFDDADLHDMLLEPQPGLPADEAQETVGPLVEVRLEILPERWETVRPELDRFVAAHNLTLHVRLPEGA